MKVTGTVFSGRGACSRAVRAGVYPESLLGFKPEFGSLNVVVDVGLVAEIEKRFTKYVVPYYGQGLWFWKGTIESDVMIPCAIMWPVPGATKRQCIEETNVLEILAPIHLRTKLNLKDGSKIEFSLK